MIQMDALIKKPLESFESDLLTVAPGGDYDLLALAFFIHGQGISCVTTAY